jgi:hypothetical protein
MAKSHLHPADLHALAKLATDATLGIADIAEATHYAILHPGTRPVERTSRLNGISGFVYRSVRGVTRLTARGIDAAFKPLHPLFRERASSPEREAVLAALNGVVGDHMSASGNALAIPMRLRHAGLPLILDKPALQAALPAANGRLLVMAHGLCMNDLQWQRRGHDHGAALARDLGYTPVYLHYNTGMHISENGRAFAALLDRLVAHWPQPIEELVIVCHSMGGLVTRSACHTAAAEGHAWLDRLKKLVFLGTPHHGAPLERIGSWADILLQANRYTAPFARLGKLRSAGITDLRHASLLDEDWQGQDRFAAKAPAPRAVPLPAAVDSYAIGATLGRASGDIGDRILGDGLLPLDSALGIDTQGERSLSLPSTHQWVAYRTGHMDLLSRPEVYAQLRSWLA